MKIKGKTAQLGCANCITGFLVGLCIIFIGLPAQVKDFLHSTAEIDLKKTCVAIC